MMLDRKSHIKALNRRIKDQVNAFKVQNKKALPILDPKLVFKLVDDIWEDYLEDADEHLLTTLVKLGLLDTHIVTEEDIKNNTFRGLEDCEIGDEVHTYSLEDITKKLQR